MDIQKQKLSPEEIARLRESLKLQVISTEENKVSREGKIPISEAEISYEEIPKEDESDVNQLLESFVKLDLESSLKDSILIEDLVLMDNVTNFRNELTEKQRSSLSALVENLKPLLDETSSQDKLLELISCYGQVADESGLPDFSKEGVIAYLCQSIDATLKEMHPNEEDKEIYQQKKELLRDMILTTAYPPLVNKMPIRILTTDRLIELLNEIVQRDPEMGKAFAAVGGEAYFSSETSQYQKLLLLSHLNITDRSMVAANFEQDLFQKVYNSPKLSQFLIQTRIHVPQTYRQTCVGTSYNMFLQRQCGSIAELLMLAKEAIRLTQENLEKLDKANPKALAEPAYEVTLGTAPTKKAFAEGILETTEQQIKALEEKAINVAKLGDRATPEQIAELTREWNFAMQYLATVMNPLQPVIVSTQVVPDAYKFSAVLSAFATGLTTLLPGQPTVSSRWKHGIQSSAIDPINKAVFGNNGMALIQDQYTWSNIQDFLNNGQITVDKIWDLIHSTGGGLLSFVSSRPGGGGHTVFFETAMLDGKKTFYVLDPMTSKAQSFTTDEFTKYLNKANHTTHIRYSSRPNLS